MGQGAAFRAWPLCFEKSRGYSTLRWDSTNSRKTKEITQKNYKIKNKQTNKKKE